MSYVEVKSTILSVAIDAAEKRIEELLVIDREEKVQWQLTHHNRPAWKFMGITLRKEVAYKADDPYIQQNVDVEYQMYGKPYGAMRRDLKTLRLMVNAEPNSTVMVGDNHAWILQYYN